MPNSETPVLIPFLLDPARETEELERAEAKARELFRADDPRRAMPEERALGEPLYG